MAYMPDIPPAGIRGHNPQLYPCKPPPQQVVYLVYTCTPPNHHNYSVCFIHY